jgi:hypothetical protein
VKLSSQTIRPSLLLYAFLSLFMTLGQCQVENVADVVSTPVPASGHDYIKLLNETVDPSTGSVSLRIDVPTPSSRGLTLPFRFTYDSGGETNYIRRGGWGKTTCRTVVGDTGYRCSEMMSLQCPPIPILRPIQTLPYVRSTLRLCSQIHQVSVILWDCPWPISPHVIMLGTIPIPIQRPTTISFLHGLHRRAVIHAEAEQ